MRRLALLAAALTTATVLAACGSGSGSADTSDGTTTTSAKAATPSSTTTAPDGFATAPVDVKGSERGLLSDVKATASGGVDSVTFTFQGALPGYRVEYVDRPVVQDGSGEEVQVDGDHVLQVRFEPASGYDLENGHAVYTGPQRLDLATTTVKDVVRNGDFEAVLRWAVGVEGQPAFRVRTATSPSRVILEVRSTP
jgi:hypothetical protein